MDETTTPLRDRVAAPETVEFPDPGPRVSWRPATPRDAAALTALERSIGATDHPGYVMSEEEIRYELVRDGVHLPTDSLVAVAADGELVGWALCVLLPVVGTVVKVSVGGGVHPARRGEGLGTAMFAWFDARGRQQLASVDTTRRGWLSSFADQKAEERIALHEAWGYERLRWWFEMSRDLAADIPVTILDPGLRLVLFSADLSERTRQARNVVFRDHWGSQDTQPADWEAARSLPIARHDLSWLAVDMASGEVVAFVLSQVNEAEWAAAGHSFGYIEYVGVRREWRGRHVAQALLNHTMRGFRDAGLSHATLDVDSESPTGATGLYTGLGFEPINRSVSLVRVF